MDDDRFDALVSKLAFPAILGVALGLAIGRQFGSVAIALLTALALAVVFGWARLQLENLPK